MKKRILALVLAGMLSVPMIGCNTNVTLFGKEIIKVEEPPQQEEEKVTPPQDDGFAQYDEGEILNRFKTAEYTLRVEGVPFVYTLEDVVNALFDGNVRYEVEHYEGTTYTVQASDVNCQRFVTYIVDMVEEDMLCIELYWNNQFYQGTEANDLFPYVVYEEIFNPEDGTLTKKQQVAKEEQKQEANTSKEQPKETKKEKKQETPKTCQWCHTNQLPSGAGTNDKCKECQQESWNFDCNDCGKNMSIDEYWSYGHDTGFCPSCYDKYAKSQYEQEQSDTDHKCYYCDRCGKDITYKNFVQNFTEGGYNFDFICEGCLLDLGY